MRGERPGILEVLHFEAGQDVARQLLGARAPGAPEHLALRAGELELVSSAGELVWFRPPGRAAPTRAVRFPAPVRAFDVAADGRTLAAALDLGERSRDEVWAMDLEQGRVLLRSELASLATQVAVAPDGGQVAVALAGGVVSLFRDGQVGSSSDLPLRTPGADERLEVEALVFSEDGEVLISLARPKRGGAQGLLQGWALEGGLEVFRRDLPGDLRALAVLPGDWLQVGTVVPEGWELREVEVGHEGGTWLLAAAPGRCMGADRSRDQILVLGERSLETWGADLGELRSRDPLPGPEAPLGALAFASEAPTLLAGAGSRVYRLGPEEPASTLVEAPGDELLCLGIDAGAAQVLLGWRRQGVETRDLAGDPGTSPSRRVRGLGPEARLDPEERRVAFFGGGVGSQAPGGSLVVRHLDERSRDRILGLGDYSPQGVCALSPRAGLVACVGFRRRVASFSVLVLDLAAGKRRFLLPAGARPPTQLCFSPAGDQLAVAGTELLEVWDLEGPGRSRAIPGTPETPLALAFHPDGRHLVASGRDRSLSTWDLRARRPPRSREHPATAATHLAFSPEGTWLATGGEDGAVWLWESELLLAEAP